MRDELLNDSLFLDLDRARQIIGARVEGGRERKTMKAWRFSDARKAFILKHNGRF